MGFRSAAPLGAGLNEEIKMSRIAISSEGPDLDDPVDPRFGRAAGFILIDPTTMTFDYVENGAAQARAQGAGIQAAETVARAGATAVLTGYVGPKAFQALAAAGIRIAQNLESMSVREAVERFKSGTVQWSELTDAKGYGG
jgi:predicted Fe-Mo cluster-binding NifX family protein